MSRTSAALGIALLLLVIGLKFGNVPERSLAVLSFGYIGPHIEETRILFVGDVMLGRYVETLVQEKGSIYPFVHVASLRSYYDEVIGNFEAPIPDEHVPTPAGSFSFSVASSSITELNTFLSAVSLANNHIYDQGVSGPTSTMHALSVESVASFGALPGDPIPHSYIVNHGEYQIGILGLQTFYEWNSTSTLARVEDLSSTTDMQIVYIHWGEEYRATATPAQREIAHDLIDAGVDAVIGHHPHVVQEIEWYNGAPIFYSLGNFIFDQYFSEEVQEGLGVELELVNESISYRIVPFTSHATPSQPRLMAYDAQQVFLKELAAKSSPELKVSIERGRIEGSYTLQNSGF